MTERMRLIPAVRSALRKLPTPFNAAQLRNALEPVKKINPVQVAKSLQRTGRITGTRDYLRVNQKACF